MDKNKNINKIQGYILLIIGVIFLAYSIIYTIIFKKVSFGIGVISILSILLCIDGFIKKSLKSKEKIVLLCEKFLDGILIVTLVFFFSGEMLIQNGLREESNSRMNNMVILGCGLEENGEPSQMMKNRLDAALEYLFENDIENIIVSGGQGSDEKFTESLVMKKYLVKNGIKSDKIIEENKSTSTFENLSFTKDIITKIEENKNGKLRIVILTSDFHMFRSKLIAEELGFTATGVPSSISMIEIPQRHVREYFAIINTIMYNIGL
ncbi:YdcF family protein [Oceanirhabdus seepicola]|uniref:YdcF family protein n=1 Tax=Oceanirhabdus seepicola TaxID=2828781 RepID=A0A9J6P4Y4_9CLOT|nr:YdcF family protein [Oceanirhabdus seepicola]MCM1991145.1 YdcF family protein [Oceanirhabdus seepicola]